MFVQTSLVSTREEDKHATAWINPAHVIAIIDEGAQGKVILADGGMYRLNETAESFREKIIRF